MILENDLHLKRTVFISLNLFAEINKKNILFFLK